MPYLTPSRIVAQRCPIRYVFRRGHAARDGLSKGSDPGGNDPASGIPDTLRQKIAVCDPGLKGVSLARASEVHRVVGRGSTLKVEGTRLVRDGRTALLAALTSVLLASCSTTETEPFGFAMPVASSPVAAEHGNFAQVPLDGGNGAVAVNAFVMDEDDPLLPDDVAAAPTLRPGSEGELLALQAPAAAPQMEAVTAAIAQPPPVATAQTDTLQQPPEPAQPSQFIENAPAQQVATAAPSKSRGFLSALFGNNTASASQQRAVAPLVPAPTPSSEPAKPMVQLASTGSAAPLVAAASGSGAALPGVRDKNSLFEISRRSGADDDADIDLYEDEDVQVASAAGLARLAPNGLLKQTERVDVACLKPSLVRVLRTIENHFGRKVIVTSGYRHPGPNRKARGARN